MSGRLIRVDSDRDKSIFVLEKVKFVPAIVKRVEHSATYGRKSARYYGVAIRSIRPSASDLLSRPEPFSGKRNWSK